MVKISKEKVLGDVGTLVRQGSVTLEELEKAYGDNAPEGALDPASKPIQPLHISTSAATSSEHTSKSISNVLYVVGTLIVCLGISLLIAQHWDQLNAPVRILATCGLGLAVFAGAWYRGRKQQATGLDINKDLLTSSLYTIGAVALSIGIGVVITECSGDLSAPAPLTGAALLVGGIFTAFYLAVMRSVMVLAMAVIMAIVAYFGAIEWLSYGNPRSEYFYGFEVALLGTTLVAGGIASRTRAVASQLSGTLYGVGTFAALGALFFLTIVSGFNDGQGSAVIYDVLYPIALAGGVALSVYTRSRDVLVITAMYLTAYIFEISVEYFFNFLGGSVALCLAGVLVMAMAYGATRFAKRYVSVAPPPIKEQ